MSPKESSLALIEEKEAPVDEYQEPQLKVLEGKLIKGLQPRASANAVQLGGQITVSF